MFEYFNIHVLPFTQLQMILYSYGFYISLCLSFVAVFSVLFSALLNRLFFLYCHMSGFVEYESLKQHPVRQRQVQHILCL